MKNWYEYPVIAIERNGEVIKLTMDEKLSAFYEMSDHFDLEDVVNELSYRLEEDEAGIYKKILEDEKAVKTIANMFSDYEDNNGHWRELLSMAIDDYVEGMEE